MRSFVTLFFALATLLAVPASAQIVSVQTWVEEWNPATQQWVRVEDGAERFAPTTMARKTASPLETAALATYGPFRVIDRGHAELVGTTDRHSPADFSAMLADYPGIDTLRLVEAPGTEDDRANMRVARMIRAAGITTHVPEGGSVRSGAVELFLAGATHRIDDGAEFAVHSWIDAHGRQPQDFAADAWPNRMYLEFYQEMGMSREDARAFYAMTNSVGFEGAKWLTAQEMRGWIGLEKEDLVVAAKAPEKQASPTIAYLDLNALLP